MCKIVAVIVGKNVLEDATEDDYRMGTASLITYTHTGGTGG